MNYSQMYNQQQHHDWNYMNYNNINEPLQEPVAFEDFQFSLGLDPDFAMPIPLDIPPPLPVPMTLIEGNDFFSTNSLFEPTTTTTAVLDEQDHKAFSQFLDEFFVDNSEYQRQSTILQSLDEQKRYFNQKEERIYLQQSNQITAQYIKPSILPSSSSPLPPLPVKEEMTTSGGAIRRGKPHKELLTEEEKRSNHIASEQKRRSMIRCGFKELTEIVPNLKNITNSKSAVLFKAVDYIKYLEKRNRGLKEKIKNLQVRVEVEGRMGRFNNNPIIIKQEVVTNPALIQHKTQQRQLMELQEKLQLHQKMLAQKGSNSNNTFVSA